MKSTIVACLLLAACHPKDFGPATCPAGELLNGSSCLPEACGVGTWGSLPVDGDTVYVDVAASPDGDGSESAPLTSIQTAVDLAGDRGGGLVAVAAGTYAEVIAMGSKHDGVLLAGRCKDFVTIDGSAGDSEGEDAPAIEIIGRSSRPAIGIEGVTVTGGTYSGVWVQAAVVSMMRSDVRESDYIGVIVYDAEATLEAVGIYETIAHRRDGYGRGIHAQQNARLTATGCTVQGNTDAGVFAMGEETTVDLADTVIAGTEQSEGGVGGEGLWVQEGAALTATNCAVYGNSGTGVSAMSDGTTVDLVDTEISETVPNGEESSGRGILIAEGASLAATGCTVQANTSFGVFVYGDGTAVDLADCEILDTEPAPDGLNGTGIQVEDAALTATGCTVRGNTEYGVVAVGRGAAVELVDTTVTDTKPSPDGTLGRGIEVQEEATLTAAGCTVQGNAEVGLVAYGGGTFVELSDCEVAENRGGGVGVHDGASLTATGTTLRGNTTVGLLASGAEAAVELADSEVVDTQLDPDGSGRGIAVQTGAALTATNVSVRGSTEAGVFASGTDTTVALEATEVVDTGAGAADGRGIAVQEGATLSAMECSVRGTVGIGVFVSEDETTVHLEASQVLDTEPTQEGDLGWGIAVQMGASLSTSDCTVQGNTEIGVLALSADTTVSLEGTEISYTEPGPDGTLGRGIQVQEGAALTASGCTVQGNTDLGVIADGEETTVELDDTAVLDTRASADGTLGRGINVQNGAALTANNCRVEGNAGHGIVVQADATLTASGCTIQGNTEVGVVVSGAETVVDLENTAVLDTEPNPDGSMGRGIEAHQGAALMATGCTVRGNTGVGVAASDEGTTVDLVNCAVSDTDSGRQSGFGLGILAQAGATFSATDSEISATDGVGFYVASNATASLDGVSLVANHFAGALVVGGFANLTSCTIEGTLPDAEWGGGFGVYAISDFGPGSITLLDSTIGLHDYAAIWLDGPGAYRIERNQLSGSAGVDQGGATLHGNAVFAENGVTSWDGTTGLLLADNTFHDAAEIGVLLHGSSATLSGNSWSDNGADLRQQVCTDVIQLTEEQPDWDPDWDVCPAGNVLIAYDMEFSSLYLHEVESQD